MPYYETIAEDLRRAKDILQKGKPTPEDFEHFECLPEAFQQHALSGGTIHGVDTHAAYKLLESFVAEIEKLTEQLRQVLAGKVALREDLTMASERVLTLELENHRLQRRLTGGSE